VDDDQPLDPPSGASRGSSPDRGAPRGAPPAIEALARQRADARAGRRWAEADALRERIEAAGWRPIDAGTSWTLVPLHPPDVKVDGRTRYGSPDGLPSRLADPDDVDVTLALLARDRPASGADVASILAEERALDILLGAVDILAAAPGPGAAAVPRDDAARRVQLIGLVDGPAEFVDGALAALPASLEVVATSTPLAPGACLEMVARRAIGRTIAWLDAGWLAEVDESAGLAATIIALEAALADPSVAAAGTTGLRSNDLAHLRPSPPGDAAALAAGCLAFRRRDARERGPLDQGYRLLDWLAIWWTLRLRDGGHGSPPRRAVAVPTPDGPRTIPRHIAALLAGGEPGSEVRDPVLERAHRRDRYRVIRSYGRRRDLILPDT
jgi:hypothetical protein